ncbi:DGQHR domain-containing protein [Ferrimonas balearica]|uniref:DGQHR domain-containing protein n=1 Tax=Ferrimonas balearica TaxID=44012 RepID=UPI001C98C02A|nr:DGQHR domain-containing protein [Ferrimonas balearica]MBY5980538.1 DGQHR domain-containing protein [Ferrimonas balearica]
MNKIECSYITVSQPIGDFYCCTIAASELVDISFSDIRRMKGQTEEGIDNYLGIQRELSPARTKKLKDYVRSVDATFPNSVILAIPEKYIKEVDGKLVISYPSDMKGKVAKILDGQHRLAGFDESSFYFTNSEGDRRDFELLVTIFVGADLHTQAQVFTMVNQNQTKVNKSLVYDLESLAVARSPYRTAHQIAVLVNSRNDSPFKSRIKRLGIKTDGINSETITQAAFVENLVKLISKKPSLDRDILLGKKKGFLGLRSDSLPDLKETDFKRLVFRKSFVEADDATIAVNVMNYYKAIENKWPKSWSWKNKDSSLNKTVGLIATMRFLRDVINIMVEHNKSSYGEIISQKDFSKVIDKIDIEDSEFDSLDATSKTSGYIYKLLKSKAQ